MKTELNAIAIKAQTHPKHRFQNLYGLLDAEMLEGSWGKLNKQSAPGLDGVIPNEYQQRLPENIERLSDQLKGKQYRVGDIKRVSIPKGNGKQRVLGLPIMDDKVVQQAVTQILQSIWEQDFLPSSYGYRAQKSAHQAVQSLQLNLQFKGYGYIVEADIKGFFDNMSHQWLMEMLSQRIEDKALLNLINQWLKARVGTKETGFTKPDKGSPQGGIISPVLANIYLHYALDLWFEKRVKPSLEGKAMLIRYADDFVVAFQYQHEAKAFYQELPERLKKFGLEVAEEKTHLKRFSRFQIGKERSFQFLGFEFYWDRDRKGMPIVRRRTATKRHNATLKSIDEWIKSNRSKRLNRFMPML
jgi:RNA-directed DNA polymerase